MTASRILPVALLAGALFVSGCGTCSSWGTAANEALTAALPCCGPAFLLAGAAEGEVIEEVDTAPETTGKPAGKGGGIGLTAHAGVFMTGGASDFAFDPCLLLGVTYDLPLLRSETLTLEVGGDFGRISNPAREMEASMILLSASARFAPGGGMLYVMGSGTVLIESYVDDQMGESGSNAVPLVGLGAGLRPAEGRWDARVGYSFLLGSENLLGVVALAGGYTF